MEQPDSVQTDPSRIMQVGMGYWLSKALLAAVKFSVFTHLSGGKLSGKEIKNKLSLKTTDRHVYDWLDALVSAGFLNREGLMDTALYSNTADTDLFLDRNKPSYIGGILEMGNNRLYRFWGDLEEGLLTGKQQNEGKEGGDSNMAFFNELYKDHQKLQEFMDAMTGIQMGNFSVICNKFDFGKYKTMLDIGGADGSLCIQVCQRYASIRCTIFDLPPVEPLANKKVAAAGLSDRIQFLPGDFLLHPWPQAEIITMGNILHGLKEDAKQEMVNKAHRALTDGGVLITIENIVDDERRSNTFGMLMSLTMLIENGDAFEYMPSDFNRWTRAAGFKKTEFLPLAGPSSVAIAYK
jgi:hypothetical protein